MKLIDKIRAEVEKKAHREQGYRTEDAEYGYRDCASEILSFLDTLEVKEVDLENEITDYINKHYHIRYDETLENGNDPLTVFDFEDIARYFFELGSAVSNKAQNIWHDASEKLPTGVIVVNNGGNLHIGWSTDEGDGIEDEHGRLITKTYQKWAREKDLT